VLSNFKGGGEIRIDKTLLTEKQSLGPPFVQEFVVYEHRRTTADIAKMDLPLRPCISGAIPGQDGADFAAVAPRPPARRAQSRIGAPDARGRLEADMARLHDQEIVAMTRQRPVTVDGETASQPGHDRTGKPRNAASIR
jgi:hypothetical protein